MPIANLFSWTENGARTHDWCLVSHDPASTPSDDLARLLAQLIMERRCCGCPQYYAAWKCRFDGGEAPAGSSLQALTAFIRPVFGLPGAAGTIPQDHLEGYVAMQLWYFLTLEAPSEQIVRIEPPDFLATDRGGDGMVIHRTLAGYFNVSSLGDQEEHGQFAHQQHHQHRIRPASTARHSNIWPDTLLSVSK